MWRREHMEREIARLSQLQGHVERRAPPPFGHFGQPYWVVWRALLLELFILKLLSEFFVGEYAQKVRILSFCITKNSCLPFCVGMRTLTETHSSVHMPTQNDKHEFFVLKSREKFSQVGEVGREGERERGSRERVGRDGKWWWCVCVCGGGDMTKSYRRERASECTCVRQGEQG